MENGAAAEQPSAADINVMPVEDSSLIGRVGRMGRRLSANKVAKGVLVVVLIVLLIMLVSINL